jgi:hypothetical protein
VLAAPTPELYDLWYFHIFWALLKTTKTHQHPLRSVGNMSAPKALMMFRAMTLRVKH